MLDRITKLTDMRIQEIEAKQQEIANKISSVQTIVDGIENDIYEDGDNYEFEIICPYCNYEFTTDIEEEGKNEIQCPECHNTIELDWNTEEEVEGHCSGGCSHCMSECVAEEEEEYKLEENETDDDPEEKDEDM